MRVDQFLDFAQPVLIERVNPQQFHPARRGRNPTPHQGQTDQHHARRIDARPLACSIPALADKARGGQERGHGENAPP